MLGFRVWDNMLKTFDWPFNFYLNDLGYLEYVDCGYTNPFPLGKNFENRFIPMQSIGQCDKDDMEMFEGDIVWIYEESNIQVIKNASDFLMGLGEWDHIIIKEKGDTVLNNIKILGNIHSNPELLESMNNVKI
jgi:hypothetical protein